MEYPSPSKDKPMGFWASPRSQMDNSVSVDGFNRPEDPFNGFSELLNFDSYAGWCNSPSAADQMLLSFALSAGYSPYELGSFLEQVKGGFLPNDCQITEFSSLNSVDENGGGGGSGSGSCQPKNNQEISNGNVQKSLTVRSLPEKMLKALSLFKDSSGAGILAQVWVPIKVDDKYILSICEQPYLLDQALAGYREVSRGWFGSYGFKPP